MKKLKLGIIGAGSFFLKRYLEEISEEKRVELVSLCRTDKNNLNKIGKLAGVKKLYSDAENMMVKENLDFVLITSPHSKHFDHVKMALENNINVLIEKPLIVNENEKKKIQSIIKKTKKKIISIYNPPYEGHFHKLRSLIYNRSFGGIKYINIFWSDNKIDIYNNKFIISNSIKSKNFRFKKNIIDGSILFDSTLHLIAELLWVSNKLPKRVFATVDSKIKPLSIKMFFDFGNNFYSDVYIKCDSKFTKRVFKSSFWGDFKKISVKGKPVKIVIEKFQNNKIIVIDKFKKVKNPINEMVDYLKYNKKPSLNIDMSLNLMSVIFAIKNSFKNNKIINVKY